MNEPGWQRLKELFEKVLDLAPDERTSFLARLAQDDPDTAAQLSSLLEADQKSEHFLAKPVYDACQLPVLSPEPSPGAIPKRIGRYEILSRLDTGGMGTVYKARDSSSSRIVALKVMRQGLASEANERRFAYEAIILSHLEHPGIAQVLDSGQHEEDGLRIPFFVMEFIEDARDLLRFCREENLGFEERVDLLIQVVNAVHHGHQKGIIHRDLKPGNILVGADGLPKVIDYGVACVTEDAALTTLHTQTGQFLGTVGYMSPEQGLLDPRQVDLRSDVYALGSILYELICERPPHDLRGLTLMASLEVIRRGDPPPPRSLNPQIPEALETIVQKAIRRDPDHRYPNATELSNDLSRWQKGEPIHARPTRNRDAMKRFVRRHRVLSFLAVAALALAAFGATAGVLVVRRITDERNHAQNLYNQAEVLRQAEADRSQDLHHQNLRAEYEWKQVLRLLEELVEAWPVEGHDFALSRFADRSRALFSESPAQQAAILTAFADIYRRRGDSESAMTFLTQSLELLGGTDVEIDSRSDREDFRFDRTRLQVDLARARAFYSFGRTEESQALYQEVIRRLRPHSYGRHADLLVEVLREFAQLRSDVGSLTHASELLLEAIIVQSTRSEDEPSDKEMETIDGLRSVMSRQLGEGRMEEVKSLLTAAIRNLISRAENDARIEQAAVLVEDLTRLNLKRRRISTISSLLRMVRELRRIDATAHPYDDPKLIPILTLIGDYALLRDDLEISLRVTQWSHRLRQKHRPGDRVALAQSLLRLSEIKLAFGQSEIAESLAWNVLERGPQNPILESHALELLAEIERLRGHLAHSESLFCEAQRCLESAQGPRLERQRSLDTRMGHLLHAQGDWKGAETLYLTHAPFPLPKEETTDYQGAAMALHLAHLHLAQEAIDEGQRWLKEADHRLSGVKAQHRLKVRYFGLATWMMVLKGRLDQAIRFSHLGIGAMGRRHPIDHPFFVSSLFGAIEASQSIHEEGQLEVALLDDLWNMVSVLEDAQEPSSLETRFMKGRVAQLWAKYYRRRNDVDQAESWKVIAQESLSK